MPNCVLRQVDHFVQIMSQTRCAEKMQWSECRQRLSVPASQVLLLNNRLLPGVHKGIDLIQQQKFVQIYKGGAFSESFRRAGRVHLC